MIGAVGRSAFAPDLERALGEEDGLAAVAEEMRALAALRGEASFRPIIEAGGRFGAPGRREAAIALARATGPAAVNAYFDGLSDAFFSVSSAKDFFLWASRGDWRVLGDAGRTALCRGDLRSWKAVLRAAYALDRRLDHRVLLEAFRSGAPEAANEAAWYLALEFASEPVGDPDVRQELVGALTRLPSPGNPDDAFGRELALRVLGVPRSDVDAWVAWRRNGGRSHAAGKPALAHLFSVLEQRVLDHPGKSGGRANALDEFERIHEPPAPRDEPVPEEVANLTIRTLDGFPRGLVHDVLTAGGCDEAAFVKATVDARIVFREDGRAGLVRMLLSPSVACMQAAGTLYQLALARNDLPPFPNRSQVLVLPLDPELVAAIDRFGSLSADGASSPSGDLPDVVPPVEISRAKPVFPEDARLSRWQGVVVVAAMINRDGRVNPARVLRSTGTLDSNERIEWSLELAALRAVTQWRYKPGLAAGRPAPVYLTVTVSFTLKK